MTAEVSLSASLFGMLQERLILTFDTFGSVALVERAARCPVGLQETQIASAVSRDLDTHSIAETTVSDPRARTPTNEHGCATKAAIPILQHGHVHFVGGAWWVRLRAV